MTVAGKATVTVMKNFLLQCHISSMSALSPQNGKNFIKILK